MREPLVLCEGADVVFFRTAADAEAWFEPWYVATEEFQLFDSDGCLLSVTSNGQSVTIADLPMAESRRGDLASRLRDFFLASGHQPAAEVANAEIEQLIALGLFGRDRGSQ